MHQYPEKRAVFLFMVIAILNVLPALIGSYYSDFFGDGPIHLYYLQCFFENFAHGVIIPKWCGRVNNSLGAPVFTFYFPLAYYASLIFYPFKLLGVTYKTILFLSIGLASFGSMLGCYTYLRSFFPPRTAIFCAIFYLYLPYHAEVSVLRIGFAEAWLLAIFPWLVIYARRLALDNKRSLFVIIPLYALCLLAHTPTALILALGMGIYVLSLSRKIYNSILYALACIWAMTLLTYYFLPAFYYQAHFLIPATSTDFLKDYPNRHPNIQDVTKVFPLIFGTFTTLILLCIYAARSYILRKKALILQRQEAIAWFSVFIVAFVLYLPISRFAYDAFPILEGILFPWRMQILWLLPLVFCVGLVHDLTDKRKKVENDLTLIVIFLACYAFFSSEPQKLKYPYIVEKQMLYGQVEYHTIWTDESFYDHASLNHLWPDFVYPLTGSSTTTLYTYDYTHSITFTTRCESPRCTIRLHLSYFPIWQLFAQKDIDLFPEAHTGMALVSMPEGNHSIKLRVCTYNSDTPWWIRAAPLISGASLLLLLLLLASLRKKT
ncbi:MAG: hypothetical protein U1E36_01270 [Rickettsiales bacterium]